MVYAERVSTPYKIKEVADRSGFSAATLRYYEEIGLLPRAARTPAGYRMYDEGTVERLAFVARAKQLGCSLDEIADLALAWDGGKCDAVQDRLRRVVADKLGSAQQQIVELMTLSSELQRAAVGLELHRPEGPCDEQCGCITDNTERQAITLVSKPGNGNDEVPIACTLAAPATSGRFDEWGDLLAHVASREAIGGGIRATFGSTAPLDELIRLAAAEQDCCQFFSFAITVDARGIALEVRAPDDALPIVEALFGAGQGTRR